MHAKFDLTILHTLSAIASEQAKPTKQTLTRVQQLLDYMATNPDAVVRFYESDMILNLHSDASGRSRARGCFFLSSALKDKQDIQPNGIIHITCAILKLVAASAAEVELGALWLSVRTAYARN